MFFKRKNKKEKESKRNMWTILGIESKRIKWAVRVFIALFIVFLLAAIGNTLSNSGFPLLWWILSGICCCAALGIIIFKSKIS